MAQTMDYYIIIRNCAAEERQRGVHKMWSANSYKIDHVPWWCWEKYLIKYLHAWKLGYWPRHFSLSGWVLEIFSLSILSTFSSKTCFCKRNVKVSFFRSLQEDEKDWAEPGTLSKMSWPSQVRPASLSESNVRGRRPVGSFSFLMMPAQDSVTAETT